MGRKFIGVAGGVLVAVAAILAVSGCTSNPSPSDVGPAAETPAWGGLPADLKVVGVDAVAKDPKWHAGKVAVAGVVSKVFAERGAFNLIDTAEFAACGTTTCAEYTVPVLVPKDEFRGELPREKQTVLAVGEVRPNGKGYSFVIQEVRGAGGVILARTKPAVTIAADKDGGACCDDDKCAAPVQANQEKCCGPGKCCPDRGAKKEPEKKDAAPKTKGCCDCEKCTTPLKGKAGPGDGKGQ